MSTELVRVTIDERDVHVPKGTGIVETALAAGVEIPVFCYEPRLGAPVGACRMCLVEVEGMPKLQTGCTLTAQDGMVVKTARTSDKAAGGERATLEFILVNHPLDCPVCDKGGECPLQDLTFRYGPGNTRMSFEKLTFEKPIPISPTISLDRERCILCYRCTRFSESVSEDGQLIAANRGALSVITTFEDLPYTGAFTGNVTELCPVGALLPTQYRFEGRPWEIVDVPTVCGLCPVGCNIHATVREGKVKRILSRNHPEIDEGWICDKGRFAFTHLRAEDRLAQPLQRVRRRGLEQVSWEAALEEAERLLRAARGRVITVLSGSETVEQAYALGRLLRVGLDSHQATLPEEISGALDAYRLPLSAIRDADVVVVLGDVPVVERAPVVDLWIKAARRNGARILEDANDPAVAEAERVVLVWSGPGGRGGATVAKLAQKLGLAGREGCGAFYLPETPNGRGVADAWAACCDEEGEPVDSIGLLVVSGDEAAADENVRALAEQAEATIVVSMFGGLAAGWADLILPGTGYLEREGTFVNLEGRLQRLRRTVEPPCPDELEWISQLAARFGVDLAPYAAAVFAEVSERVYGGLAFGEVGERAPLRGYPEAEERVSRQALPEPQQKARRGQIRLVAYKPLFSGAAVERVMELQFQRPQPELELSPDDARRRKIATGDLVTVGSNGSAITLPARINRRLRPGIARVALEHANGLGGVVELAKAEEAVTA
ncbi:MAG TPA: 2Fe-2S iron-sulfur cluster-binding protein [Gaiellaceae bacterium]|nr:2Fe-2S iron-sulfur cluster-binding protein [Gaiellaceae bacterium]